MSTDLTDLALLCPEIETLKEQDIVSINMPFSHYHQEVLILFYLFMREKALLEAGGMDFKRVEKIRSIASACRDLNTKKNIFSFQKCCAQSEFLSATKEAVKLLCDLKKTMYFAFRNYPELLSQISNLRVGRSNPDLIQGLNTFSTIGRTNSELLTTNCYDPVKLERVAQLSKMIADLHAQVKINRSRAPELTVLRNKAFTLLKKTIDELNLQARYIFRADKEKAARFTIRPPKKKPLKKVVEKEPTMA